MSTVRIPPILRTEVGGARQVEADGATLREVLGDLVERYPALGGRIFEDGEVPAFINLFVDGADARMADGLETPVAEGATVLILPAVAGG